jgi:hypothetical protein
MAHWTHLLSSTLLKVGLTTIGTRIRWLHTLKILGAPVGAVTHALTSTVRISCVHPELSLSLVWPHIRPIILRIMVMTPCAAEIMISLVVTDACCPLCVPEPAAAILSEPTWYVERGRRSQPLSVPLRAAVTPCGGLAPCPLPRRHKASGRTGQP